MKAMTKQLANIQMNFTTFERFYKFLQVSFKCDDKAISNHSITFYLFT